ncbi:MGMT family protein [Bdellovibrio bacteriovorus]|uniref:DNA methyltransferase n=1 Tax=Bdellovibrio bacteriovorus TaxID=959 RepID=A0A1Z3N4A6_BDEBC|nr:MGMT family protein [Bdellovibrio bacteriovorus]ASD62304.1 DNA methyltransferase [Bdellovibrio bacteriovorus]
MSEVFSEKVLKLIKKIPAGKVATYGQIAALAGKPQGSRAVAWLLHSCSESHDLPWQRVLNSKGKISFPPGTKSYRQQKKLLVSEGVRFGEGDVIEMSLFQWKKKPVSAKVSAKKPRMFS